MHVQLLMSRDGVRWKNTNKHQPFFAPRGPGHWDAHMVTMVSPPIEVGDELWFFYGGSNSRHDWWLMAASARRWTARKRAIHRASSSASGWRLCGKKVLPVCMPIARARV